jgi:prephenate dehydrogenase
MGSVGGDTPAGPRALRRVGIAGVGLIGGSLALALRRARPDLHLVGIDCEPAVARAQALGVFDRVDADLGALRGSDLVVLAAPVRENVELLDRLAAVTRDPLLVTDTGSTKRTLTEAARALPGQISFVGGHPLAGSAQAGASAARAGLFEGRRWLLTPGPATRSPEDVASLSGLVTECGAIPHVIDAEAHDRLVAALSHLPQLAASALMQVIGDAVAAEDLTLAGPGLADTTRLAASSPGIWRDICATNADLIGPLLDALIDTLQRLRSDLPEGGIIGEVFSAAQKSRERLENS